MLPRQRVSAAMLAALAVVVAIAELVSVSVVAPFVALLATGGPDELARALPEPWGSWCRDHVVLLGVLVVLTAGVAAGTSLLSIWATTRFAAQAAQSFAVRIFEHYLQQDSLFFSRRNSADLCVTTVGETARVLGGVLIPVLTMISRGVSAVLLMAAMLWVDSTTAAGAAILLLVSYVVVFRRVRRSLALQGAVINQSSAGQLRTLHEAFAAVPEITLLGCQQRLVRDFERDTRAYAAALVHTQVIGQAPRPVLEFVIIGALIAAAILSADGSASDRLPTLAFLGLAAYRLLPSLNQLFASTAALRSSRHALDQVSAVLLSIPAKPSSVQQIAVPAPTATIALDRAHFTYDAERGPALHDVSLSIPVGTVAAFVGASGSGKSTAAALLLGLLKPDRGALRLDGRALTPEEIPGWHRHAGFVPQSVYITDGSIADNIAFVDHGAADPARLQTAAERAGLLELLRSLPDGLNEPVGERGSRLSGGQRQRIAIARALYRSTSFMVLDEATSALDTASEREVMNAIDRLSPSVTIVVIAHRLTTIRHADCIYVFDGGRIVDAGTWSELSVRSTAFRRLLEAAGLAAAPSFEA